MQIEAVVQQKINMDFEVVIKKRFDTIFEGRNNNTNYRGPYGILYIPYSPVQCMDFCVGIEIENCSYSSVQQISGTVFNAEVWHKNREISVKEKF